MTLDIKELREYLIKEVQEMDLNYTLGKFFGTHSTDAINFWSGRAAVCKEILSGNIQLRHTSPAIVEAVKYSDGDVSLLNEILEIIQETTPYHINYFEDVCKQLYGEEVLNKVKRMMANKEKGEE